MNEFPKEALRSRKFTSKQKRGKKELDDDNVLVRRLCRTGVSSNYEYETLGRWREV